MSSRSETVEAIDNRSVELLGQIARLLCQPESSFFGKAGETPDNVEACELLRLWDGLKSTTDRQELLAFARTLAAGRRPA